MNEQSGGAIVLFDGVCNFCNSTINFIIAHDRAGYFRFAPLQSETGQQLLKKYSLDKSGIDSVVLIEDDKAYTHSTAALRIAKRLDGVWSWFSFFIFTPRGFRDVFYKLFAGNRYRLFGKKDVCMMPTPELRSRFLS